MTDDPDLSAVLRSGWPMPESLWRCLPPAERNFLVQELGSGRSIAYYQRRLAALEMVDREMVVDAGCGVGQWSIAAARHNQAVVGVDLSPSRLLVGNALAEAGNVDNIRFEWGSIDRMPIGDSAADAVLCYGTLSLGAPVRSTLAEFHRVLRPGGVLYCNVNDWGWYAHLVFDRILRTGNYDLIRPVARVMLRTLLGRDHGRVMSAGWLTDKLERAGFATVYSGAEGTARMSETADVPEPAYSQLMHGRPAVVEVVAVRR